MMPFNLRAWLGVMVFALVGSYYIGRLATRSEFLESQSSPSSSFEPESQGEHEATQQLENAGRQDTNNILDSGKQAPSNGIGNLKNDGNSSADGESHSDIFQGKRDGYLSYELLNKSIWEVPSPGSQMPPLSTFALSEEMLKSRAKKNVIVATFSNYGLLDFVLNWVKHLTDLGISNILVGAMDHKCLEALYWAGIPVFDMGHQMDENDAAWGSPSFHSMGREKAILVDKILSFDYELLMCDVDMVWLKDPLPYIERYPDADVLTSSDEVVNTIDDEELEVWDRSFGAYNIGIVHWRPSNASKKMAREWREQLLANDKIWDQNGFNDLMHATFGPSLARKSGLFYAYDGSLKLGILPVSIFCSGHTYFVQALYKQLKLEPYVVHLTFQFGGISGKRHRLREAKLFHDKLEYYDPTGGILSFNLSIPQHLLTGSVPSVESHFALVNHQLKQVRDALAVATILNRTLIIPELWCIFDRLWFGHPGILQGSKTPQPFLCPMDHIFEVNNMVRQMPEDEFGPSINFREYSFLENPNIPQEVKTSKLQVDLCDRDASDCNLLSSLGQYSQVYNLSRHNNEDQLFAALHPYRKIKHIHFSSMIDVFDGFSNKIRDEKFRRRVTTYTGIWCCLEKRHRGEIFYDIYWDEKPNWKPLPPYNSEDDGPPISS